MLNSSYDWNPEPGTWNGVESRIHDCPGFPYMGRNVRIKDIGLQLIFKKDKEKLPGFGHRYLFAGSRGMVQFVTNPDL